MTVSRIPNVEGGIQPTIVTAKGDLIAAVANANPARLGVGSDGQLLTADSSSATGLSYQNNFAAGKNKIINGDFGVWQRGTSGFAINTFSADRWQTNGVVATTGSRGTFALGDISGYNPSYYMQLDVAANSSSGSYVINEQRIENVATMAGQTVTYSFWAKATSGTPKIGLEIAQYFGTGGSPSGSVFTAIEAKTLSTTWTRYTSTFTIPSVTGKTIGTNNDSYVAITHWLTAGSSYAARSSNIGNQTATFQIWGVQLEAGSVATAFQTATGTIQGELAACQRYYWRNSADTSYTYMGAAVNAWNTTEADLTIQNPVPMRVPPTSVEYSTLILTTRAAGSTYTVTSAALASSAQSKMMASIRFGVASGLTAAVRYDLLANNSTSAYLALNAEL